MTMLKVTPSLSTSGKEMEMKAGDLVKNNDNRGKRND